MNINVLIDKIKKDVGLNGYLGKIYSDDVLKDSIINNSLETFNRYSGFHLSVSLDQISNQWLFMNTYNYGVNNTDIAMRIPDIYMDRLNELGVKIKRVFLQQNRGMSTQGFYSRGMGDDLLMYQAKRMIAQNTVKPIANFRAPNSIVIKDGVYGNILGYNQYTLIIECTHPKNLSTITIGLENYFEELCKYDIMINLYNNDLRNLKVDLGSSSVDMNLENFQSADSDKRNLLEIIKKKAGYDQIVLQG